METHALPSDETARLGALSRYRILDSPPETAFDDLAQLAASLCDAPLAVITFIDRNRQWVKAKVGLDVSQTDRSSGLCSHTIESGELCVVQDARTDPRFSSHALVAGGPQVRFYCGVPVVTADGYAIGTIAVMDRVPRKGTESQCVALQRLARQTAALLELRMLRCDRPASEERPTPNEEIFRVMAGTTRSTGLAFLQDLVHMLAQLTGAEYGFCVWALPGRRRARTVAGYGPEGPLEQLEYELAGTPCEKVLAEGFCYYPRAVQASFPQDQPLRDLAIESYMAIALPPTSGEPIGWIALLGTMPLRDAGQAESLLRLVAGRAGSELGRDLAERQLRKSEERFRAAYRNATVGMSIADLHGRLQEVNQRLCTILGYSEKELLTRTFQSLTHPDDLGNNLERLEKLLNGTADVDVFEKRYIRKDGGIVWAQVGLSVIRDEAGIPLYTLALVQDITERKRAEEALQLAKYTVDHATEAIYWVGARAELLDVNDSACTMLGYSKEEFRRMTVYDINPYFQADTWPGYWEQTRQKGRASFESYHRAKDGRLIPIEVNVNFIRCNGIECHFVFVRDTTERKEAETALRASEERFHIAMEATNDGIWDWNIQTGEVYYSPQWIRLVGYLPEEVPPSTTFFFAILHPEDLPRLMAVQQAHMDGLIPVKDLEVRLRQKSGEYRWYLDRGKVVARTQDGRPCRMVGTITDITERKRTEQERAEALSNLQAIMKTVPDVIFVLDLEGRLNKWNFRMETVTGYTRDELQGKPALDMVPPEEARQTEAAIKEAYENGYAELEGHLLTKDGRTILYHWAGGPFADAQGRTIGIAGVGRDITERKRTEALLRSSEERFRLVAEATNDILWDWDLVTNEHWWSPNACDKFGYDPRAELSVNAWIGRLHPEDREHILALVEKAIRSDARTLAAEYRFQLADGRFGYFLDRAHIVRDEAGAAIRMIGAMIDVTGPKRAYASLEEAYRRFQAMSQELQMVESNERRRLSRELHDEVGQLLTSLKFDLTSVTRSVAGRSKALGGRSQERLARALETTDLLFTRLRQIVRALRPPVLEELGLKAGLEALIADVQARTGLHCSLVFEQGERRAARFPTLETAFYRIVQELLTNVIRHAKATTVFVAVKSGRREWELSVKDDGIGFDVAGLSPTGGFGLRGIRERVEILAGQVEIVSRPETGTSVHVLIPVGPEPDGSLGTDNPVASSPRRRRKVVHE